jgi:hypothetical protein
MSMLYRMCRSTMLTYSFLALFGVSPHDGLVSLQICKVHFVPLPRTCASWGAVEVLIKYDAKVFCVWGWVYCDAR